MQQKVLYTEDVAVLFGLSPSTVRRRAQRGDFPAEKRGRQWVFEAKRLNITWNAVMARRKPSARPAQDFQRLVYLVENLDCGDVAVFEDEQREALDLVLGLLPTIFRGAVWNLMERLRGNPAFAFLDLVPKLVPIH